MGFAISSGRFGRVAGKGMEAPRDALASMTTKERSPLVTGRLIAHIFDRFRPFWCGMVVCSGSPSTPTPPHHLTKAGGEKKRNVVRFIHQGSKLPDKLMHG